MIRSAAFVVGQKRCRYVDAEPPEVVLPSAVEGVRTRLSEPINLNVVNADIRDILSYITDQYGINFVIDKSVKDVPVTVKVTDVPWNVALESVLQAQELGVQVNGNILRIADTKTLAGEGEFNRARTNNQLDTSPLVTELIRLNYATAGAGASAGSTTAGTSSNTSNAAYGSGVGAGNVNTGGASGGE